MRESGEKFLHRARGHRSRLISRIVSVGNLSPPVRRRNKQTLATPWPWIFGDHRRESAIPSRFREDNSGHCPESERNVWRISDQMHPGECIFHEGDSIGRSWKLLPTHLTRNARDRGTRRRGEKGREEGRARSDRANFPGSQFSAKRRRRWLSRLV